MHGQSDDWNLKDHELGLRAIGRDDSLEINYDGRRFSAPRDISTLAELYESRPHATILAGGTDVGLWVTKQHRELSTIIYTGRVRELLEQRVSGTHLEIGGESCGRHPAHYRALSGPDRDVSSFRIAAYSKRWYARRQHRERFAHRRLNACADGPGRLACPAQRR